MNMKRRGFSGNLRAGIVGICALSLLSISQARAGEVAERPNVLFFVVEDLGVNLGCYGRTCVKTPQLDALAARGILFKNAFVQQPVCAAARACLLTGLRTETVGVDYPYSCYFVEDLLARRPTLSRFFAQQGYTTRHVGKIHHSVHEPLTLPEDNPSKGPYLSPENRRRPKGKGP